MKPDASIYDYVIVGAGSAGAVLAARLTEDADVRVLLIEAGRRARHPKLAMPLAYLDAMRDPRYSWNYEGEPEPHADNRRLQQPRGRVPGGSSTIDAMLYTRGNPRDYDEWRQLGNAGWGFDDVLPYFRKSEGHWGEADRFHGRDGPLSIAPPHTDAHLYPRLVAAAEKLGYPLIDDFHGVTQEGIGPPAFTIHQGRRASTASRFLFPAMGRPNLTVATGATVDYVEFDGLRATGVVIDQGRGPERARAMREVILSGGAYNSPQILLRSGVGPADEIAVHGIPVIHDLPGVGRNLQDHPSISMRWASRPEYSINGELRLDCMIASAAEWLLHGTGRVANPPVTASAVLKTRDGVDRPDAQYLFHPTSPEARLWQPGWRAPADPVVAVACVLLRPESRGWVRLASPDPKVPPRILTNVLGTPEERAFFRRGIAQIREIMATEPLASAVREPIDPPAALCSDADLDAWVRANVGTAFHPVGSCAMGSGAEAVVDTQLRIHGLEGIRIVDASVMPRIVGGDTNAATIMIAEKAADMIRGKRGDQATSA